MADYFVSGIWVNEKEVVTDFSFHEYNSEGVYAPEKITLEEAIEIVEDPENSVYTVVWNYELGRWSRGEKVEVVNHKPKYLRSNPDKEITDNLKHLLNYSGMTHNFLNK